MSRQFMAIAIVVALGVGFGSGFVFDTGSEPVTSPIDSNAPKIAELEEENDVLRRDLKTAREKLVTAGRQLASMGNRKGDDPTKSAAHGVDGRLGAISKRNHGFSTVKEARAFAEAAVARADLIGLCQAGAAALTFGEEGYDAILDFLQHVEQSEQQLKRLIRLTMSEELAIPPVLVILYENREEILRLGLYIKEIDDEELPGPLREAKREMADDLGPVLMGMYDGDDKEILDGYLQWFREIVEGGRLRDEVVFAIAHIGTGESTELLHTLYYNDEGRVQVDILRALAWQRTPEAIQALRAILEEEDDGDLREQLQAILEAIDKD